MMTTPSSIPAGVSPKHERAVESEPAAASGSKCLLLTQESLRRFASAAGFVEAGIVNLPHPNAERDASRFERFIQNGYAGTMDYLARRDETDKLLRSDVLLPFPWARSIVVCLASYHADAPRSIEPADSLAGWIARYAWSGKRDRHGAIRPADYHKLLLNRLKSLESRMHAEWGDFEARAYVDTGPVAERVAATAAGVGWTGKNTCLIHPKLGSWNFLAVLVTSLEVPEEAAPLTVPDRCGSCRRCLDACPTNALIEPYQMDASKCISYLTIEHRGEIAEELLAGMGRQVFGCDICQDVCPWNRKAPLQAMAESGDGSVTRMELVNPALQWLAELDRTEFERLFNGSPVRRTGFEALRRNVAIAMGNSGAKQFVSMLEGWARPKSAADQGGLTAGIGAQHDRSAEKASLNQKGLEHAARWALDRLTRTQ